MIGLGLHINNVKSVSAPFTNTLSTLFDGVDEFANINSVLSALATTTVGTWSLWIKPVDATPSASEIVVGFGDTDGDTRLLMLVTTTGRLCTFMSRIGSVRWGLDTDNVVFANDTWAHIAIVQDGVFPVIYFNGVAPAQAFYNTNDQPFWFNDALDLDTGRLGDYNYNSLGEISHFNGNIDEPRFWNTNLSAAQILATYNSGVPLDPSLEPLQASLVTDFRMGDGDSFPTITDSTGGNNGTLVNMESGDFVIDVPT